jgi:hypothetical protein
VCLPLDGGSYQTPLFLILLAVIRVAAFLTRTAWQWRCSIRYSAVLEYSATWQHFPDYRNVLWNILWTLAIWRYFKLGCGLNSVTTQSMRSSLNHIFTAAYFHLEDSKLKREALSSLITIVLNTRLHGVLSRKITKWTLFCIEISPVYVPNRVGCNIAVKKEMTG